MFVYIMTNYTNNVLYTGVTNNLARRVYEHKHDKANAFCKRYRIYKLVWLQEFKTPIEAIRAEKKIKGWTRKKKMGMIKKENPDFREIECG